ncbi:MAG: hypothetical protein ACOZNI_00840 [Myxococcota bacterium]
MALTEPAGTEPADGRLFVSDRGTGEIVVYDLDWNELGRVWTGAEEFVGLTRGPDGRLWYVDPAAITVVRVDPN